MKRIAILAALAALWAGSAVAQTVTQDGNSTRTSQQAQLQGGLLRSDSTMRALTVDASGNLQAAEAFPLNTVDDIDAEIYNDTLSVNGRNQDSTTVVTCGNYGLITLGLKMSGHHGTVAGIVRLGITAIWSQSTAATDTSSSYAMGYGDYEGQSATSTVASFAADSTGPVGDGTAHTALPGTERIVRLMTSSIISINPLVFRTAQLRFRNHGYASVRWIIRVLSDNNTTAIQGFRFRLRVSAGKRAI